MSQSVVIALAGADKEDLHKAKWAEIPRQDYVDAARFCTSHGMAYDGITVNEERARELFADRGRTSEAVLQQAAPALEVEGQLQHRLEGPADTGCAGVSHEQCASIDGAPYEAEADDGDEAGNAALPDEEFPEAALPAMHFCADAVTSGDMDEVQAVRKAHSELREL